jgi:putative ABC transport system permease protein
MPFDVLKQDLRFGARLLARHLGFTAVAVLTLALGIGANAAIFSVVNAVLLRPLPWADPGHAVMIWSKWTAFDKTWVSTGEVVDYRRRARTLREVAAWGQGQVNLTGSGEPERVAAANVTGNTFSVLGVSPMRGRVFSATEDVPKGPNVVVLGHALWSRRYSADASIVGRSIQIDGRPYEVVGVMPPGFLLPTDYQNPQPSQLWVPLQLDPTSMDHGNHGLYAAARLQPGATVAQAADELRNIAQAMTREGLYPVQMRFDTVTLSLEDEVVGGVRRSIWLLFGAVGFLLLIACANVANLLLARAEARQREIAVRSALGAGGRRMVRQLLTESMLLTVLSAIAGLAIAGAAVRLLAWWNPANIPRIAGVTIDMPVALFTIVVALATSVLFGLAPALRAMRTGLVESLKDGNQGASSGSARQRFRNALVVVEMALAVVLLVGAGLTIRSLWALQSTPLGLQPSNVLTMRVALPAESYPSPEQVVGFYQRLMDRVRQLPGVQTAGAARSLPLGSTIGDYGLTVEGFDPPPGTRPKGDWQIATDGYLEAMGERVIRGRGFTPADATDTMPVALVNEELVRRYFPGREAIGGRLRIGGGGGPERPWVTIVGIVGNVRHNGLTDPVKEKFYIPHTQWHKSTGNAIRGMNLVIKTASSPSPLTTSVRDAIRALDPNLPVADIRTMEEVVSATLSTPRFTGLLLGMFALLAVVLSAIGIYGVLSYLVSRRTREIGIRMAIGADRGQVVRMVLGSGLSLALAGAGIGVVCAAGVGRLMQSVLHEVSPFDPATFAFVAITLPAIALLASAVPAWRATRVDPIVALKNE